ncbi:MAG: TolC family protein [Rhodocyclaceae bacterium]|nr:MAG: TolC family protein [Rhodocyclaceae bacterium]
MKILPQPFLSPEAGIYVGMLLLLLGAPVAVAYADTIHMPHTGMSQAPAMDRGGAPGANLMNLLELMRQNNPELATLRHEAAMAVERIYPAGAFADPLLERELEIDNPSVNEADLLNQLLTGAPPTEGPRGGSIKYRIYQDFPFWGKRDLKREIAAADADQFKGRSDKLWTEMAARMKGAFAQYYRIVRVEALTREILELFADLERITLKRYADGLAPQQDVIRAQTEQTRTRTELVGIETDRRNWQYRINSMLKRLSNDPLAQPDAPRALPGTAKLDYLALVERMKARNPQIFIADAGITYADKTRDLTYRNRWPDASIGATTIYASSKFQLWGLYARVNIPIQLERRRSQEREAEEMFLAAKTARAGVENQLLSDLSENLAQLEAARETERLARTSLVPQAELTYRAALAGYQTSKVDFAVLLEAQRQIRNAKLEQLKSEAEGQVRLAEIERLVGEDL